MRRASALVAAVLAATASARGRGEAHADEPDAGSSQADAEAGRPQVDADAAAATDARAPPYQQHPPASEFRGAPRPDDALHLERDGRGSARHLLWIPRVALYPVKWATWLVFAPLRGALYANDRYQLKERFYLWFFNDERTFGIYPLAFFETDFGLNAGGRVVHKDLFGAGERVTLRASYGGRYEQIYRASMHTGDRLGALRFELELDYEIEPHSRFFGIGNLDELANDDPAVVASSPPTALATRTAFRQDIVRAALVTRYRLAPHLHLELTTGYAHRRFGDPSGGRGADIDDVYDTEALIGWRTGVDAAVAELGLVYDSRRSAHRFVWAHGVGWRVDGFASYRRGLGDDDSSYLRYGLDAQRFFDLYGGDRVLVLRAYTEGVSASLDEVPFVELPRLGGPLLLRGYSRDRFRDRALALGTAEYQYSLSRHVWAFVFVDCGTVFPSYADADLDGLRLGYGVGLQKHEREKFQLRIHAASSTDGGLFLALSFDPVFEVGPRIERK